MKITFRKGPAYSGQMKLPKTYEIMCNGRQVGTIQHRFADWWFFYGQGYNSLPHSYPLDEAKREAKKHFSKAFTLIEVLVCVAIVAILGALICGSAMRHGAQKRGVKVEQEAKPFERFTVTYQRTPGWGPYLWLIHDNIDESDVLYIAGNASSGPGCAVVLSRNPNRWKQTLVISNTSSRAITVEMP